MKKALQKKGPAKKSPEKKRKARRPPLKKAPPKKPAAKKSVRKKLIGEKRGKTLFAKLDLMKELKPFYAASPAEVVAVDVPPMRFLMIDGRGDPNTSPEYAAAIEALYSVAYTLKFKMKKEGVDYSVPPLEGLWWADDMSTFGTGDKSAWKWTAMLMQPKMITPDLFAEAVGEVREKKNLPSLSLMRFAEFHEGNAAQILHVGPYSAEEPSIRRVHEFIGGRGGTLTGKHHEIYLGDPRRSAPEKLKTIIRQPFAEQAAG
jgi:hypothetical protein